MAKKALCVLFLLFSSISTLSAANSRNITLSIQGSGPANAVEGFKYALIIEAKAAGYQVTEDLAAAKYSIKFTVEFDRAEQRFKFNVSLVKVEGSSVIVTMEYLFADEEEMLLYSQLVFFMLMANLPEDEIRTAVEDDTWRNKWLYARASLDYSIMLLALKGDGLIGGIGAYNGPTESPTMVTPLDNKVVPVPGISLGAEVQFLDWMSAEPGVQISFEEAVKNHLMFNLLLSMNIKFPLKFFSNFVPEPYLAAAYPMRFPKGKEIFASFPMLAFGGGIQVAVKMEKNSALFFDVNYMYFGDTGMKNQLVGLSPNPKVIKYNNSVLGFRIGYKYGFFDRKPDH